MDQRRIDEMRARCDAATAGPWYDYDGPLGNLSNAVSERHKSVTGITSGALGNVYAIEDIGCVAIAPNTFRRIDAEFISHARQDLPDLLDHVAAQEAELQRAQKSAAGWLDAANGLVDEVHDLEFKIGQLREALRQVEERSRRKHTAVMGDPGYIIYKCNFCEGHFSSRDGSGSHGAKCPFKILEGVSEDDLWNWRKTCRECGTLFSKIDGKWIGKHTQKCPTLKGGDTLDRTTGR